MRGMDAEMPRGDSAENTREPAAPSGWVTTSVAAKSLDVSPRTVRWHIERGNLEAKAEGEGVRRSWLVSIDSLQALRDSRQHAEQSPGGYRAEAEGAGIAADSPGNAIRELADRLAREYSVMLAPGSAFEYEGYLLLGLGQEPAIFAEGLRRTATCFADLRAAGVQISSVS